MISQKEFESTIEHFDKLEPTRGPLYGMALNLLMAGYEVEADLLILATWNFANFRYILKEFDLDAFRRVITETAPIFCRLKERKFETADFDELADDIKTAYSAYKNVVGQTGAAKLLHFKHTGLFVMWDTDIRRRFKIPNESSPEHFILFLKKMKTEFGHIRWERQDRTFAKAIDEFNFVLADRKRREDKKPEPPTSGRTVRGEAPRP